MKNNSQQSMLNKLKKQVIVLRRKEKLARQQLKLALAKAKKAAKIFESTLEKKSKAHKAKVAAAEAAVYTRLAKSLNKKAKQAKRITNLEKPSTKLAKNNNRIKN